MKNRTNTRWLTQLALLVAVLLVMNYTPQNAAILAVQLLPK